MTRLKGRTVADLLPAFIQSRADHNLRATTMVNYGVWKRWMAKHWGSRKVSGVRAAQIEGLLKTKSRSHAERTRCFFRWLVVQRVLRRTFDVGTLPLAPRSDERPVCYLTPAAARKYLAAVQPRYRAAFILGLYAGLRPYECCRIDWASIHRTERRIKVEAWVSKIRRARILEGLPPILWQLLRPLAKKKGRVLPAESETRAVYHWIYERHRVSVRSGVPLGHDIFRHTFATYYVALTGHPAMAAKVLGHYKLHTLAAHYDGVATRAEARDYFRRK